MDASAALSPRKTVHRARWILDSVDRFRPAVTPKKVEAR
jgi:hypothetical protein